MIILTEDERFYKVNENTNFEIHFEKRFLGAKNQKAWETCKKTLLNHNYFFEAKDGEYTLHVETNTGYEYLESFGAYEDAENIYKEIQAALEAGEKVFYI